METSGESLVPPRKVTARSHRISPKGKNGPVITPLYLITLPGESGNMGMRKNMGTPV